MYLTSNIVKDVQVTLRLVRQANRLFVGRGVTCDPVGHYAKKVHYPIAKVNIFSFIQIGSIQSK